MPLIVSYFIVPVVFMLLAVNIYFRVKMVRQFKFLKEKNIQINPKILMNKKQREAYISKNHPQYKNQLLDFSDSMNKLIRYVIIGFLLILVSFLYIYFSS